jgi:hypothetical protein
MLGNHGHGSKEVHLGCSGDAGSVVEERRGGKRCVLYQEKRNEDHSYRTGSFVKNCTLMALKEVTRFNQDFGLYPSGSMMRV